MRIDPLYDGLIIYPECLNQGRTWIAAATLEELQFDKGRAIRCLPVEAKSVFLGFQLEAITRAKVRLVDSDSRKRMICKYHQCKGETLEPNVS